MAMKWAAIWYLINNVYCTWIYKYIEASATSSFMYISNSVCHHVFWIARQSLITSTYCSWIYMYIGNTITPSTHFPWIYLVISGSTCPHMSDILSQPTSNVKLATQSTPLEVFVWVGPLLSWMGWVTEFTLCHGVRLSAPSGALSALRKP